MCGFFIRYSPLLIYFFSLTNVAKHGGSNAPISESLDVCDQKLHVRSQERSTVKLVQTDGNGNVFICSINTKIIFFVLSTLVMVLLKISVLC